MFNNGDKVRAKSSCYGGSNRAPIGEEMTFIDINSYNYSYNGYCGNLAKVRAKSGAEFYAFDYDLEAVKDKKMTIKDSFALAFKAEPERSFRKVGITNGDDFLTEDGQHIFLSWLLKKHGEDFKKEVVDDLVAEQEKSKA